MRVIVLLSALMLVASMPPQPSLLPTNAPQIVVLNSDCDAAQLSANIDAQSLGFSNARLKCAGYPSGDLNGVAPPHSVLPTNLIAYSVQNEPPFSPASFGPWIEVPSSIPFVASVGHIVAYVKPDAMIVFMKPDNIVNTAFALEAAGVPKRDMFAVPEEDQSLYVRVRPVTAAQFSKIERVASAEQREKRILLLRTSYIGDCNKTIASLGGAVLMQAQRRARVMAEAAGTHIGTLLAVFDASGGATDAVCGFGEDASMQQLVAAAKDLNCRTESCSHFYATVVRNVSAAWRLTLPPNPPTTSWRSNPDAEGRFWDRTPFIADGSQIRAIGGGNNVEPDRVMIFVPDWAKDAVRGSGYARNLEYYDGELSLPPVLQVQAPTRQILQQRVTAIEQYFSRVAAQHAKSSDLVFRYSRDDCSNAIDGALYNAVKDAVKRLNGKRLRYLQQYNVQTIGLVYCGYEVNPQESEQYTAPDVPPNALSEATIVAAY